MYDFKEYFSLNKIYSFVLGLALVIIALCYIISVGSNYNEKLSSYECGFNVDENLREIFYIKLFQLGIYLKIKKKLKNVWLSIYLYINKQYI